MTREDSITIAGMVALAWPGKDWSAARLDMYAKGIEHWDAELATKAVLQAQQHLKYRPSVAELHEFLVIERKMAEPEPPIERMLNDTPSRIMPPWVRGWVVGRVRHRDMRVWSEQQRFLDGEQMPPDAREAYIQEAAGLPVEALFKQILLGQV